MEPFWYFMLYSFLGFLLEVGYAWCTGGRRDRKRTLLLPLCPVYGLGALAVLALPQAVRENPLLLMVCGGAAATGVEYATAAFYEKVLGVSFWDYRENRWNLHGRVCAVFSLAWAALLPVAVYGIHPVLAGWAASVPAPVTGAAMAAAGTDLLLSALLLRRTGTRDCLQWYRRGKGKVFLDTSLSEAYNTSEREA